MEAVVRFGAATLVLFAVFGAIERLFPEKRGQRRLRPGLRTDLAFWLLAPLVNRVVAPAVALAAIVVTSLLAPRPGAEWIATWPLWAQIAGVLVIGDGIGYWLHRAFHRDACLWRFHAVHHSSSQLDWLSSARVHPANQVAQLAVRATALYWIGFEGRLLAAYAPLLTFLALLVHANVPWRFGPLGYLIASPAWHRWHHAADAVGEGRNFAGLFPFWDYLFGTAHFPREPAAVYGLRDDVMPEGFYAQLAWPMRRSRSAGVQGAGVMPTARG